MKKLILVITMILSVTAFAKSIDASVLKLTPEKQSEFSKLPQAVQSLMVQEALFKQKIDLLNLKKQMKLSQLEMSPPGCGDDGNHNGGNYSCVPRCASRSSFDGSCNNWGSDFCGDNASCSENCTSRSSFDGSCNSYGPDICY